MTTENIPGSDANPTSENVVKGAIPAGDTAAIAMALFMFYDEVHDNESNVITIKRIERRYSPWSSKIYGISKQI